VFDDRYNVEGKLPQPAKSSSNAQDDKAIYEDVICDSNSGTTKDTITPNPAYSTMRRVDMSQNPSYVTSKHNTEDSEYL